MINDTHENEIGVQKWVDLLCPNFQKWATTIIVQQQIKNVY